MRFFIVEDLLQKGAWHDEERPGHKYYKRERLADGKYRYWYHDEDERADEAPGRKHEHEGYKPLMHRISDEEALPVLQAIGDHLAAAQDSTEKDETGFSNFDVKSWGRVSHQTKADDPASMLRMRLLLGKYKRQISGMSHVGLDGYYTLGLNDAMTHKAEHGGVTLVSTVNRAGDLILKPASYIKDFQAYRAINFKFNVGTRQIPPGSGKWEQYVKHADWSNFDETAYREKLAEIDIHLEALPDRPEAEAIEPAKPEASPATVKGVWDRLRNDRNYPAIGAKWDREKNAFAFRFPFSKISEFMSNRKGSLGSITKWDSTTKPWTVWVFDIQSAELAIQGMKDLEPKFKVVTEGFDEARKLEDERQAKLRVPIPEVQAAAAPGIELYPYQNEGVRFLLDNDGNAMLGDEMGLGKSAQALAYGVVAKKRLIVVNPKNTRRNWIRESQKFFPSYYKPVELDSARLLKVQRAYEKEKAAKGESFDPLKALSGDDEREIAKRLGLTEANLASINYESVGKFIPYIKAAGYDAVIIDESHRMKDPSTKVSKTLTKLAEFLPHRILMSGTPIKNSREEFFTQFNLVRPGMFEDAEQLTANKIGELWDKMRPFYLARQKRFVLKDLPDRTTTMTVEDMPEVPTMPDSPKGYLHNQWALAYAAFLEQHADAPESQLAGLQNEARGKGEEAVEAGKEFLDSLEEEDRKELFKVSIGQHAKLTHAAAIAKVPYTAEFAESIVEGSESNVLVFTQSKVAAKLIAKKLGPIAVLHHGDMSQEDREAAKARFDKSYRKPDETARVFVSTIQAAKEGINLTAANMVVFNDLPWTAADVAQAEARAHRIGQDKDVSVYWMTAADNKLDQDHTDTVHYKYLLHRLQSEGRPLTPAEQIWMHEFVKRKDLMNLAAESESLSLPGGEPEPKTKASKISETSESTPPPMTIQIPGAKEIDDTQHPVKERVPAHEHTGKTPAVAESKLEDKAHSAESPKGQLSLLFKGGARFYILQDTSESLSKSVYGQERPGHKYISRKLKADGSYEYEYAEVAKTEHAAPKEPEWRIHRIHDLRDVDWDTGKRIPLEAGAGATCDRCGKEHAVVYHMEHKTTGKQACVGSGCGPGMAGGSHNLDDASVKQAEKEAKSKVQQEARAKINDWVAQMEEHLAAEVRFPKASYFIGHDHHVDYDAEGGRKEIQHPRLKWGFPGTEYEIPVAPNWNGVTEGEARYVMRKWLAYKIEEQAGKLRIPELWPFPKDLKTPRETAEAQALKIAEDLLWDRFRREAGYDRMNVAPKEMLEHRKPWERDFSKFRKSFGADDLYVAQDDFDLCMSWAGRLMEDGDFDRAMDLIKGAMHKYLRRYPSGKASPRWYYVYKVTSKHQGEPVSVGEKIKLTHEGKAGHYEVKNVHANGYVTMQHDETGHQVSVKQEHLHEMFTGEHKAAIDAAHARLKHTFEASKKYGSDAHQSKAREALKQHEDRYQIKTPERMAAKKAYGLTVLTSTEPTVENHTAAANAHKAAVEAGADNSELHTQLAEQHEIAAKSRMALKASAEALKDPEPRFHIPATGENVDEAPVLVLPPKGNRGAPKVAKGAYFAAKEKAYKALVSASDTNGDFFDQFHAADKAYRAWQDAVAQQRRQNKGTKKRGKGIPRPPIWEGGELDHLNHALGLEKPKRVLGKQAPDPRLTSPAEAWDRLVKGAKRWDAATSRHAIQVFQEWFQDHNIPMHLPNEAHEAIANHYQAKNDADYASGMGGEHETAQIHELVQEASDRDASFDPDEIEGQLDDSFDFGFNAEPEAAQPMAMSEDGPRVLREAKTKRAITYLPLDWAKKVIYRTPGYGGQGVEGACPFIAAALKRAMTPEGVHVGKFLQEVRKPSGPALSPKGEPIEGKPSLESLDAFLKQLPKAYEAVDQMAKSVIDQPHIFVIQPDVWSDDYLCKGGGPYVGPRGGMWADPQHTQHWDPTKHAAPVPSHEIDAKVTELTQLTHDELADIKRQQDEYLAKLDANGEAVPIAAMRLSRIIDRAIEKKGPRLVAKIPEKVPSDRYPEEKRQSILVLKRLEKIAQAKGWALEGTTAKPRVGLADIQRALKGTDLDLNALKTGLLAVELQDMGDGSFAIHRREGASTPDKPATPEKAATINDVTPEQMNAKFPIKLKEVDWGKRPRGQGKRSGGMVLGGMSDVTIQGVKHYTDYGATFGLTGDDASEVGNLDPFLLLAYWKARTFGLGHDDAMRHVYTVDDARKTPEKPAILVQAPKPKPKPQVPAQTDLFATQEPEAETKPEPKAEAKPETKPEPVKAPTTPPIPAIKAVSSLAEQAKNLSEDSPEKLMPVGEHIWGSIRDLRRKRIESSKDLEAMTYDDAVKIVNKKHLVPAMDLKTLKALGQSPGTAHMTLALLSSIVGKPGKSIDSRNKYVDEISEVLKSVQACKNLDDFKTLTEEMRQRNRAGVGRKAVEGLPTFYDKQEAFRALKKLQTDDPTRDYEVRIDYADRIYTVYENIDRPYAALGNRFVKFIHHASPDAREAYVEALTVDNAWGKQIEKVGGMLETVGLPSTEIEDGWGYLETRGTKLAEKAKAKAEKRAKVANKRGVSQAQLFMSSIGKTIRKGGEPLREANTKRLKETFNLKVVDYGTEGYMTQADREFHTSQLEGAMHDLKDVLGLQKDQMSFNGRLGIEVGGRGTGEAPFAHYESDRFVINLTKLRGGSALAHEWGHALDNVLTNLYRPKGNPARFISETPEASFWPAHVKDAYQKVHEAISLHPEPEKAKALHHEATKKLREDESKRISEYNGLEKSYRELGRKVKPEIVPGRIRNLEAHLPEYKEQLAIRKKRFDELEQKRLAGGNTNRLAQSHLKAMGEFNQSARAVDNVEKELAGLRDGSGIRTDEDLKKMQELEGTMSYRRSELNQLQRNIKEHLAFDPTVSDYKRGSVYMRGDWGEPTEMFARAFECYVVDKFDNADRLNTYLVSPSRTKARYDTEIPMPDGSPAQPFPHGKERDRILEAVGNFMQVLQKSGELQKAMDWLVQQPLQRFTIRADMYA